MLSSDFVLLAGPPSDDHLEEEDRLERDRRILDHRQAVWRQARARQQGDLEARQDRLRRDLARSTSLQVYVPLVSFRYWYICIHRHTLTASRPLRVSHTPHLRLHRPFFRCSRPRPHVHRVAYAPAVHPRRRFRLMGPFFLSLDPVSMW